MLYKADVQIAPHETDDGEPLDIGTLEVEADSESEAIDKLLEKARREYLTGPNRLAKGLALGEGFQDTDIIMI